VTGPVDPLPRDEGAADVSAEVEAAMAGLDDSDLAAHADAFEAVNNALLAELQRLEAL
jgi:hypothetical protein